MTHEREKRAEAERRFYYRANAAGETITLATPISGCSTWTEQSAWLKRQTWPHHKIRLLLFDTSGDHRFHQQIRDWISTADYPDVRHVITSVELHGLADEDRRDHQVKRDVQLACAKMYNQIRLMANEGEYLWIVEDDIIPPDDVAERLMSSMGPYIASVSAVYNSRYEDGAVVFDSIRTRMKPSTVVEPCRGNGFGCVMLRTLILSEYVFTHRGPTNDYDHNFYDWLNRHPNCNGALVDWDCWCRHLSAMGDKCQSQLTDDKVVLKSAVK